MLKYILPFVALAAVSSGLAYFGADYAPDDYDVHALKQVEKNKSVINVLNKGNNLFLSGDVRAKWMRQKRENNGADQFGSGTGLPNNQFVSEVNLLVDYDASCAWAQVKLNFRNCMGVVSGTFDNIGMERAFVGYDFIQCGDVDLYAEVGRQKMDYLFESEVMYNTTFDGLLVGLDYSWDAAGDFFIHGGGFVIDDITDDFGWVGEAGLMEIMNTGLYAKYSFIHWRNKGVDRYGIHDSPDFRYNISQLVVGYVFDPQMMKVPARVYAAGLVNSSAKKTTASANQKRNWAWYAGVEIGKLEVAGDWSLNVNYQWVELQAIPNFDVAGIGNGYTPECPISDDETLWNPFVSRPNPITPPPPYISADDVSAADIHGNTNYKGLSAVGFYNVTANLALRAAYKFSNQITKAVGGSHKFQDFELGVIYSF
jgi:hypothetical protein